MAPFAYLWLVFLTVWVIAARQTKRTKQREELGTRVVYGIFTAAGCYLLVRPSLFGALNVRYMPETTWGRMFGLALTAAGIGVAFWARFALGRNWSGRITIKEDHELIQSGPYRFVRHPIYSGLLLALTGVAIGYDRASCLLGIALVLVGFRFKWKAEESFMTQQFGAKYVQYQHEVKAVIPGVL